MTRRGDLQIIGNFHMNIELFLTSMVSSAFLLQFPISILVEASNKHRRPRFAWPCERSILKKTLPLHYIRGTADAK